MEIEKGTKTIGKTKTVWASIDRGGFADGQSYKLSVGASQNISVDNHADWIQAQDELVIDLKNQVRKHLTPEGKEPKLFQRVVRIIMPK